LVKFRKKKRNLYAKVAKYRKMAHQRRERHLGSKLKQNYGESGGRVGAPNLKGGGYFFFEHHSKRGGTIRGGKRRKMDV